MKINSIAPALLLGITALIIGHFFSLKIVEDSKAVARIKLESTEPLLMVNRIMNINEWNPISKTAQKTAMDEHDRIIAQANEWQEKIDRHSIIVMWLAFVLMSITALLYLKSNYFNAAMAMALAFAALLFLRIGVDAPAMEIQVYSEDLNISIKLSGKAIYEDLQNDRYLKHIPFLEFFKHKEIGFDHKFHGKIYYQYQSKSILESIVLLFKANNQVVALALLLFSVIFPLLKVIFNIWILLWPRTGQWEGFSSIVYYLGKWSMADVFVVSMFLAYLSFHNMGQQGVTVDSQVSIGFYFFLAYVIVSITSGILTQNWIRQYYKSKQMQ
ncbi:MAG: paraquat-inducible protein A [Burkholderiales bacterium]|nr:paraquat-inducible protein A [Nitrosomonas sp.]MCP5273581.1 paraquat-inducible protein A [Burkholderiales bacterium]